MKSKIRFGIVTLLIVLTVGFAAVATKLIVNGGASVSISNDFEVIFSSAYATTGGKAIITDQGRTLDYKAAPLTEIGDQTSVTYSVTNNSANYDADLDVSITDDNGNPVSSDYFTIEETEKLPTFIESRSTVSGKLTITKTKSNNEEIHAFFKITINANPVERDTLGNGEYIAYTPTVGGLYDEKNNLITDWDTLVNKYGLDISKYRSENEILGSNMVESAINNYLVSVTGMTQAELEEKYGEVEDENNQLYIDYPELKEFIYDDTKIYEYMDYNYSDKSMLGSIIHDNEELQKGYRLVIDDSVSTISPGSFLMRNNIKEVVIPSSVTNMTEAFMYSASIEKVVLQDGIKSINPYAFVMAIGLKTVVIPSSVENISSTSFFYCPKLENIENSSDNYNVIDGILYDKDMTSIIVYPGSKKDEVFNVPEGVVTISANSITSNYLKTINISSSVRNITSDSFENTLYLENINVDENNPYYKSVDGVLYNKDLTEIVYCPRSNRKVLTLPEGLVKIDFDALQDGEFEVLNIPSTVSDIDFSYRTLQYIKEYNVSENNEKYKSIDGVLYSKDGKTLYRYPLNKTNNDFNIPDGVEDINYSAFGENMYIENISIPSSTTSIGDLNKIKNLKSINLNENNTSYVLVDGVLYNKNKTKLIRYVTGKEDAEYIVESTVTSISDNAFNNNKYIEKVVLPDGINEITSYMFKGCTKLNNIVIPKNIDEIGSYAFKGCSSLTSVIIPEKVNRIGWNAFEGCSNLISVVFENPNGWKYGNELLSSDDLSDDSLAARYLTKVYIDNTWRRN